MAASYDSTVFINVPYDNRYGPLYLALISGLCAFGLTPRATLEILDDNRRLDKIYDLMSSCKYSFHDLSRVELDRTKPFTPRFNMPFELGLVIGWKKAKKSNHSLFVLEAVPRRLEKSLSDYSGTDPLIHHGNPTGMLALLRDLFVKTHFQPKMQHLEIIYSKMAELAPKVMDEEKSKYLFAPRVFRSLVVLATDCAENTIPRK